ncbi:hypothetical protein [Actinotalea sp.]|uniref:hypothetical protein n=1 Tax=Actinotalea sp. TaxID=1872145 RepID=UPI003565E8D6
MTELAGRVEAWRASAERLLELAETAGPLSDEEFRGFTVDGHAGPEAVEDEVDRLLAESDHSLEVLAAERVETNRPVEGDPQAVSLLLANLEMSGALLTASRPPAEFFVTMGVDGSSAVSFDETRVRLADLHDAVLGTPPAPPAPLPDGLTAKLDGLQDAGAEEIVELATSPTVWAALGGFVGGVAEVGGPVVREAIDLVKGAVKWLQRGAVKIIAWVINKLKQLVPESAREKIDELVAEIKEKLAAGSTAVVAGILGQRLGRPAVEKAWRDAAQSGTGDAETRLATVTDGHLARIGRVSSARTAADSFSVVIGAALAAAVPAVSIVVGALALAVFAFVGYEVWDGFNDIEALV